VIGDLTFEVRVYKTSVYRGQRGNTYKVRWRVARSTHSKVFPLATQAEAFRSELISATRKGEAFSPHTGEPASWARAKRAQLSWYDFACSYVDMKWHHASAKYRQDIARALTAATPALILGQGPASDRELRSALNLYGFNTKRREDAPHEVAARLGWLSANTHPVQQLTQPGVARRTLDLATSLLDGRRAAPDTVRKHRMVLANAMDYAIELELLDTNPIRRLKWAPAQTSVSREVDRRSVVNHRQARSLLEAVSKQQPSGARLVAFFALMYYAALRPEEAVNVRHDNVSLPSPSAPDAWGELELTESRPHAGRHWTDDGALRDSRSLKHRNRGDVRLVPMSPPLAEILRTHLREFPDGASGRLFYGVRSADLPSTTYMNAWRAARRAALSPREEASALARRPYDLRHACVSTWLNAGVPAPQVAQWAGHSVDVLLRIYARCIEGQDGVARARIAAALDSALQETDETADGERPAPPVPSV
jgi:integrase